MSSDETPRTGRRGALDILRAVRTGELDPSEVAVEDRRACVGYLRLEGYTQEEIAEVFRVSRQTISNDEKVNREEAARLVDDLDVRVEAGKLIGMAEHLTAKSLREKDFRLAWQIRERLVDTLQSMGYLPRAAEQHQVQLATFADLGRLAQEEGEDEKTIAGNDAPQLPPGEEDGIPDEASDESEPGDGAGEGNQ